jgi:hypothetical protein
VNRNCWLAIQQHCKQEKLGSNLKCIKVVVTSRSNNKFSITTTNCFLLFSKLQLLVVIITPNQILFCGQIIHLFIPAADGTHSYHYSWKTFHGTATLNNFQANFHGCKFLFSHSRSCEFSRPCVLYAPPNSFPRPGPCYNIVCSSKSRRP